MKFETSEIITYSSSTGLNFNCRQTVSRFRLTRYTLVKFMVFQTKAYKFEFSHCYSTSPIDSHLLATIFYLSIFSCTDLSFSLPIYLSIYLSSCLSWYFYIRCTLFYFIPFYLIPSLLLLPFGFFTELFTYICRWHHSSYDIRFLPSIRIWNLLSSGIFLKSLSV